MFPKDHPWSTLLSLIFISIFLTTMPVASFFALNVPFKAQVPPGEWELTQNCGQTCALMVFCYYSGIEPTEQGIKNIDDWLFDEYGDPINNYNGSLSNTTKLEALAREYGGFPNSYEVIGWDLSNLRQEIDAGRPVIVAVTAGHLSNRGYSYTGGHFVVVKNYNDTHIICNDPGTSQGGSKYYVNSEFLSAMSAQNGSVVVILPDNQNVELVGTCDTQGSEVCVVGNYAYVTDSRDYGGGGLRVIDVSDPTNPYEVGFYSHPGPGHAQGVHVVGSYAYIAYSRSLNSSGSGLRVIDISDPLHPYEKGFWNFAFSAWGVYGVGSYAGASCTIYLGEQLGNY